MDMGKSAGNAQVMRSKEVMPGVTSGVFGLNAIVADSWTGLTAKRPLASVRTTSSRPWVKRRISSARARQKAVARPCVPVGSDGACATSTAHGK